MSWVLRKARIALTIGLSFASSLGMNTAHPPPIFFTCPGCSHTLRVVGSMSGLRTDCPTCRSPVTVPSDSQRSLEDVPSRLLTSPLHIGR